MKDIIEVFTINCLVKGMCIPVFAAACAQFGESFCPFTQLSRDTSKQSEDLKLHL